MKPGTEIAIRIDQTLTQDSTGTMAYLQFEAMGIPRVKTKSPLPILTTTRSRQVLRTQMTINIFRRLLQSTEYIFQNPVTEYAIRFTWRDLAYRE